MKMKKLNARASAYANSVKPEDNKSNDACWMAARRGYIAGWNARKEKGKKCVILGLFGDDIIPMTEQTAQKLNDVLEPKSLKPEDLEDGEIYTSVEDDSIFIFRNKSARSENDSFYYSIIEHHGNFNIARNFDNWLYSSDHRRICRHATLPEKLKLIGEELKYGYTHK
jgi:hypothetical protein